MPTLITYKKNVVPNYLDSVEKRSDFQVHCHNIYEIYYFLEGDADYFVEGKQYKLVPNSILLLAPHALHGVRINSDKPYRRFTIHFNADLISIDRRSFLLSPFPNQKITRSHEVYYQNVDSFNLRPFFDAIVNCKKLPTDLADKLLPVYIEALLSQLVLLCRATSTSETSIVLSDTAIEIIDYINKHLTEPMTLDSLSKHFFISKNHINRIFRTAIGTTVFDYITYKRIGKAQYYLGTGLSPTVVATKVGFNDYSTFYRAYKKITGHSPAQEILLD